ncbi:MAG: hypothetical protein WBQ60_08120 [Asticcacaulis sp.]
MNITRDDAAKALSDIAQTEGRSRALFGYRIAGPIMMIWGVIWIVCYAAMGVTKPEQWGMVWIPADIIGILASMFLSFRIKSKAGATSNNLWRIMGFVALIGVFCASIFTMFRTDDVSAYLAFPGLLTGTIYAAIGLARMTRFLWVGMAVIVFTLIGYAYFPAYLTFWMAITGGGGLLVGGFLMRRA